MEEQHSFDEFFRESLADYRETPPPAAWDMVAARLDDDDRRRRGFFYWPWIALSMLLMIGGAWWLYGWNNNRQLRIAASRPAATEQRAGEGAIPPTANEPAAASGNKAAHSASNASRGQGSLSSGADPVTTTSPRLSGGPASAATTQGQGSMQTAGGPSSPNASSLSQTPGTTAARSSGTTAGVPAPTQIALPQTPAAHAGTARELPTETAPTLQPAAHKARPVTEQPGSPGIPLAAPQPSSGQRNAESAIQPASLPRMQAGSQDLDRANPPAFAVRAGARPLDAPTPDPVPAAQAPALSGRSATPELTPTLAATITAPVLLASLDPILHVFAGAPTPPILSIYETGLLEPTLYQAPPAASVAADAPAAAPPAMYPPDSTLKRSGSIMSLSAFLGYERGIKTPPRNMFTVGISLMWQLSQKFAIGTQPALLYGNLPRTGLSSDKAYQRSAVDVTRFVTRDYSPSILGQIDTVNNYVIREAFDSIVVRGTYLKGSMWQLELPLILQFNPFGAAFRLYGGPSMYFGGSMKVRSEGPERVYTIDRKDSVVQSARMSEEQIKSYFGKSSLESYSTYNSDLHSFNNLDPVRFGYQVGIGYQRNRMSFDASMRQQLTGYHQLSDRLRQLYALPAFRLSFGYTLIPAKRPAPKPIPYAN